MQNLKEILGEAKFRTLVGGKGEPYVPTCLTCYDLGNYECSLFSDGTDKPRFTYTNGSYIEDGIKKRQVHQYDNTKQYLEDNPNVTEVMGYRRHCPTCHPKFVAKHTENANIAKDKNLDETTRNLARAEISKLWGLSVGKANA